MFSYNAKVRYSEVDSNRKLTIPAIVNYLQDTCVMHSEAVNAGLDYVKEIGRVWMLGAWRIEFLEDIEFQDEITVNTWPYGFRAFMGYRNLTIEKDNRVCVRADSSWMLYSLKEQSLVKAEEMDIKNYPCEDALDMEKCKRKLTCDAELIALKEIIVTESFIDTNGHVNNGKYVLMAVDSLNLTKRVTVLEAEYKKAAKLGDVVIPFICEKDSEAFVSLRSNEGEILASINFLFD